jgi:hypothetical protein
MQFYLLILSDFLSGLISGSTVLAQTVTGYYGHKCAGSIIFSNALLHGGVHRSTSSGTKSVDLPRGVECELFEARGCRGPSQFLDNFGCNPITL